MTESQQAIARRMAEKIKFDTAGLLALCEVAVLLRSERETFSERDDDAYEANARSAAVIERYGGEK